MKGQALASMGKTDDALAAWKEYVDKDPSHDRLNSVGFELADRRLRLDLATDYTERAVRNTEQALKDLTIATFDKDSARRIVSLAAEWDSRDGLY